MQSTLEQATKAVRGQSAASAHLCIEGQAAAEGDVSFQPPRVPHPAGLIVGCAHKVGSTLQQAAAQAPNTKDPAFEAGLFGEP